MTIRYDFDGYDYEFEVPFEVIQEIFDKDYVGVTDDPFWWLQFEENEKQFEDEQYEYLKERFYNEAFEEAKEVYMDPYEYYGVSRSDF